MINMLSTLIQKAIDDHKASLEDFRDQYQDPLNGSPEDKIADLIQNCDWESEDFNVGFENGFLSGMYSVLHHVKAEEKKLNK